MKGLLTASVTALILAVATVTGAQPVYELVHAFPAPGGVYPRAPLVQGSDGNFYGTTYQGGSADLGTAFRVDQATGVVTKLHDFTGGVIDGAVPYAAMILGLDGFLYGTSTRGGLFDAGCIYRMTNAGVITIVHSFNVSGLSYPYAPVYQTPDGTFWGTTSWGPAYHSDGFGSVYKFTLGTPTNTFQTLKTFTGAPDARNPGPLRLANDGNLYGVTLSGGSANRGTIIKVVPGTGVVSVVHHFAGAANGSYPRGGVTEVGGVLFGATEKGGTGDAGTIFSFVPSGPGGTFNVRHSFTFATGDSPSGGLTLAGGLLYGTTARGGAATSGTIFQFNPATNASSTVHDFTGADGAQSLAAVTLRAATNELWGTTVSGGPWGAGVVFKQVIGSAFTLQHAFRRYTEGRRPTTELTAGSDGNLYGITALGGIVDRGTVFKMTSGGVVTTLHEFTDNGDGSLPAAGVVQATDGLFYGVSGGVVGSEDEYEYFDGVQVFKVTSAGVFTVVRIMTPATEGFGLNSLIQLPDGFLYGTAQGGGASGNGTVFKMTTGGTVTVMHTFAGGAGGSGPGAALVRGTDGFLYGTTTGGGNTNDGTVFRIGTDGSGYQVVHHLNGPTEGAFPRGPLIQATDGFFYGTTYLGTATTFGSVYKMASTSPWTVTIQHAFQGSPTDGKYPVGALVQVPSLEAFFGTTSAGNSSSSGTVYQITNTGTATILHNFTETVAGGPSAGLTRLTASTYYGTTPSLGSTAQGDEGGVYRIRLSSFTDDPLVVEVTTIKALHFTELRNRIDAVRGTYALGPYPYSDATTAGTGIIRAVHINALRTALAQAYTAAGRTPPTYTTDPTLTAGTLIKAAHITELRNALVGIE